MYSGQKGVFYIRPYLSTLLCRKMHKTFFSLVFNLYNNKSLKRLDMLFDILQCTISVVLK